MEEEKIVKYMTTKKYKENQYICWDFVRDIYLDLYDMELPEYPVDEIQTSFKNKTLSNIPHIKVEGEPIEGDVIVFSLFANQHAGVMIDCANFIHLAKTGVKITSIKEVGKNYAIYRRITKIKN